MCLSRLRLRLAEGFEERFCFDVLHFTWSVPSDSTSPSSLSDSWVVGLLPDSRVVGILPSDLWVVDVLPSDSRAVGLLSSDPRALGLLSSVLSTVRDRTIVYTGVKVFEFVIRIPCFSSQRIR